MYLLAMTDSNYIGYDVKYVYFLYFVVHLGTFVFISLKQSTVGQKPLQSTICIFEWDVSGLHLARFPDGVSDVTCLLPLNRQLWHPRDRMVWLRLYPKICDHTDHSFSLSITNLIHFQHTTNELRVSLAAQERIICSLRSCLLWQATS